MIPRIPSASHARTNEVIFGLVTAGLDPSTCQILDFGAGRGHMCQRLGDWLDTHQQTPATHLHACEIAPADFKYAGCACHAIGTDSTIPFPDNSFDVIYSIEVMEHLPRPFDFLHNAWQKLKLGGRLIISIPNPLHLQSRFKILFTGFGELFGPPSAKIENAGGICGHIMPLPFSHLHYGLRKAGFANIRHEIDRRKKGAMGWYFLLWPLMQLGRLAYQRELKRYDRSVFDETSQVAYKMNSFDLLTSRSNLLVACKPME
jgi:SAM-dependent methyltransferase